MIKYFIIFLLLLNIACEKKLGDEGNKHEETSSVQSDEADLVENSPGQSAEQTMTDEFMTLINNHRISLGLDPLIYSEGLSKLVLFHSQQMANGSLPFGHTGFSLRCAEARQILEGGNWCGENVAQGQETVQDAFTAWMNSSGHRANIEYFRATHTGFGFAKAEDGTYYWTQIFLEMDE